MKWINGLSETSKAKIFNLKCDKDLEEKEQEKKYLSNWHKWFAWKPVIVDYVGEGLEEHSVKCWLCSVERKGKLIEMIRFLGYKDYWKWEYREIKND